MALFLDNLIVGIVRHVRREMRLSTIRKWSLADATIHRFRTIEGDWHGLRPAIDYAYRVNGEQYFGSATGCSLREGINEIGDSVEAIIGAKTAIRIRYDPAEPGSNYLLNSDNPHFALDVDDDLL